MPDDAARFARIPALLEADAPLRRRGRHCTTEALFGVGDTLFLARFREGRIAELGPAPVMPSVRFVLHAPADAWLEHWRPLPAPGFHDILAMTKAGTARLEGDLRPVMRHLQFLKDVLALPRREALS